MDGYACGGEVGAEALRGLGMDGYACGGEGGAEALRGLGLTDGRICMGGGRGCFREMAEGPCAPACAACSLVADQCRLLLLKRPSPHDPCPQCYLLVIL